MYLFLVYQLSKQSAITVLNSLENLHLSVFLKKQIFFEVILTSKTGKYTNSKNSYRNALNVVKDDLIVKVDELTGEIDMLRDEILSLDVSRTKLR